MVIPGPNLMMDDPIPSHGKSCANQLGIARGVWDHDTDDLLNEGRSLVAGCPIARPNLFFLHEVSIVFSPTSLARSEGAFDSRKRGQLRCGGALAHDDTRPPHVVCMGR